MRRGAFDYLPKPFTPAQVRAVLATEGLTTSMAEQMPKWPGSEPPTRRRCARPVAEIGAQRAQQLYPHAHVALAGLLIDRRDAVRVWVQGTLGPLARDDQSAARLRDTLPGLPQMMGTRSRVYGR